MFLFSLVSTSFRQISENSDVFQWGHLTSFRQNTRNRHVFHTYEHIYTIYIYMYIHWHVHIYIHIRQVCLYSYTYMRRLDASSGVCTWRKGERSSSTDRTQVCISYEEIDDTQCRSAWPSRAHVQHGWYVSPGVGRLCGECRPSSHRQ